MNSEKSNEERGCTEISIRTTDESADKKHMVIRDYDQNSNLINEEEYEKQSFTEFLGSVGSPSRTYSVWIKKTSSEEAKNSTTASNNE